MLIQGCEILGFDPDHGSTPYRADMRVEGPLIAEIGEGLIPATGETVLDGRGNWSPRGSSMRTFTHKRRCSRAAMTTSPSSFGCSTRTRF